MGAGGSTLFTGAFQRVLNNGGANLSAAGYADTGGNLRDRSAASFLVVPEPTKVSNWTKFQDAVLGVRVSKTSQGASALHSSAIRGQVGPTEWQWSSRPRIRGAHSRPSWRFRPPSSRYKAVIATRQSRCHLHGSYRWWRSSSSRRSFDNVPCHLVEVPVWINIVSVTHARLSIP